MNKSVEVRGAVHGGQHGIPGCFAETAVGGIWGIWQPMDYSEGLEVMSNDLGEAPHDQGEREGSAGPDRGAPHACMHGWLVVRGKMGLMVSTCMSQGA